MATVSVTFDNLGEAAELERGTWPEDRPLGEHFSVRESLPQLLALLAREDLRATFFVEGLNGELYPEALRGLRAAGHEVACHGWRHEPWHEVSDEAERLARARDALGGPTGFRPPGGRLNADTPEILAALGYRYCSPAGDRAGRLGGLAVLPFRWELIDAYFYLPHFASRRAERGDPEAPMEPATLRERVLAALDGPCRRPPLADLPSVPARGRARRAVRGRRCTGARRCAAARRRAAVPAHGRGGRRARRLARLGLGLETARGGCTACTTRASRRYAPTSRACGVADGARARLSGRACATGVPSHIAHARSLWVPQPGVRA